LNLGILKLAQVSEAVANRTCDPHMVVPYVYGIFGNSISMGCAVLLLFVLKSPEVYQISQM
jgi:hypothetical protein